MATLPFTKYLLALTEVLFWGMLGLLFQDGITRSSIANAALIVFWVGYSQVRIPYALRTVCEFGSQRVVEMPTARGISAVFAVAVLYATLVKPLLF